MWNNQSKEQPQMWSTHDLACAHCRTRKIRCGRERPQCESCKRDGVECRYSSPGKRINHVKLLCQNFEALEDQLNNIQGDLSVLTSLVKNGGPRKSFPALGEGLITEEFDDATSPGIIRKDRHVIRNETHATERYHGPSSLFSLCKEFRDDLIFQNSGNGSPVEENDNIRMVLEKMCADAGNEEHVDIASEHTGICLPPRQFLNIVIGPFFQNADYATDLFMRSNFHTQLDRVYSHPLGPADEAWAVCFNIIVLLAIGKDQSSQKNSPFIQPFLQTLKMTVNNPRVFFSPRLVNVQVLALLSHIAEQYSPPGFSEMIFAQACLLARTMGLHQRCDSTNDQVSDETIEKQKVFRSLYIRDKHLAICRGSSPWLSSFDSNISQLLNASAEEETAKYGPRVELARIQDEVYRNLHPAEALSLTPAKQSHLILMLEQKLDRWATANQVLKKATSSSEWAALSLSFFATRICISRSSDDPRLSMLAFNDAKASCFLFLLATAKKPDPRFVEGLEQILGRKQAPSPLIICNPDRNCDSSLRFQLLGGDETESAASLPRLVANLSLAAIFQIAKNVAAQPIAVMGSPSNTPEEEMLLLEAMRDSFMSTTDDANVQNLTQKLGRTLDTIVCVIRHKRFPKATNTPSMIFNDMSSIRSSASSGSQQGNISGSRKDAIPDPDAPSALITASEAASTSSMLLPFMQPFDSPTNCSPWPSGANPAAANGLGISPWPVSYKQQIDGTGRVGKRPRLPSQPELFEMTTAFAEQFQGQLQKADEDPLSMFDFLSANNDVAVFDADE